MNVNVKTFNTQARETLIDSRHIICTEYPMASPDTSRPLRTEAPTSGRDELDDIFDYDAGMDDPFADNYQSAAAKAKAKADEDASKAKASNGLGNDEEIEVTRKARAPRVKLDEHRCVYSTQL